MNALVSLFLWGSNSYKQRLTNLPQNSSNIAPEWLPKWLQNGSKIDPRASWRAPGAVLAAWRPLGASWKPPGSVLEASWSRPEASWSPLEASWKRLGGSWSRPGAQKPPKMDPKKDPNRGPKAVRAENCKTLIFYDSTKDLLDF